MLCPANLSVVKVATTPYVVNLSCLRWNHCDICHFDIGSPLLGNLPITEHKLTVSRKFGKLRETNCFIAYLRGEWCGPSWIAPTGQIFRHSSSIFGGVFVWVTASFRVSNKLLYTKEVPPFGVCWSFPTWERRPELELVHQVDGGGINFVVPLLLSSYLRGLFCRYK